MLAIDANGDGAITPDELLSLGATTSATADVTNLRWLDSDANGRIGPLDAAYAALRVWTDNNRDGVSSADEVQTFGQAGLHQILFSDTPLRLRTLDGRYVSVDTQTIDATVTGVAYQMMANSLLESKERGETVLYAINGRNDRTDLSQRNQGSGGDWQVIPFLNKKWHEGESQTVQVARQARQDEADKVSFYLKMESLNQERRRC